MRIAGYILIVLFFVIGTYAEHLAETSKDRPCVGYYIAFSFILFLTGIFLLCYDKTSNK